MTRRRPSFIESLESRLLLSDYFVSNGGSDSGAGTASAPWATLQFAANHVQPGDTVHVAAGNYAGFVLGWDFPQSGTAQAPITFQGAPGATINARNNKTPDAINLEGSNYVTIEGFNIYNPSPDIWRAGIRSDQNTGVIIRNNTVDANAINWGIFTSFSLGVTVNNNTIANANQYGIYVSNSVRFPTVRNNIVANCNFSGIHFNADATQGGPGITVDATVDGNIVYGNGKSALGGISLDGVQFSRIINNLIYNNGYNGIMLYRADASAGSSSNGVENNTIVVPSGGQWAVYIANGSTGNNLYNNILTNASSSFGSINLATDSRSGFKSDYNVVTDRFGTASAPAVPATIDLAKWQANLQSDEHSILATPAQLFVAPGSGDFRLKSDSPAIDAGTATGAPPTDIAGDPRPSGKGVDIGAVEFQVKGTNPIPGSGTTGAGGTDGGGGTNVGGGGTDGGGGGGGGTGGDVPSLTPVVVSPIKLGVRAISRGRTRLLWIYHNRPKRKIGYLVERSTDGIHFRRVAKLAGAIRQRFIDTGLKKNKGYIYRIRAYGRGLRPVWSASIAVRARP